MTTSRIPPKKEPPSKKAKVEGLEIHYQEAAGLTPWTILEGLTDDDVAVFIFYRSKGRLVIGDVSVHKCLKEETA